MPDRKLLDHFADLLAKGRISRRDFLARAAALGVSLPLATSLAGKAVQGAEPKQGGHLRIGVGSGSTTHTLDPALIEDTSGQIYAFGALRNCLTNVEPSGELGPELAESWEGSDDATTWVINLRKGVEFHNGKTMDSADVIATLQHHMGEDSKSASKALLESVTEIKADGPERVIVNLSGGNADFPFLLSDYHFGILPSVDGTVDALSGVGTGPFIKENYEPGVRQAAKRNPNYFKDGVPYFDSVEILTIIDVAARTNAISSGEIDVMDRCDLKTVHLLKRQSDLEITSIAGTQHYTFAMRTDTAPFDDNNVRMALKYGVNREALVETILRGYGLVGNDHPIAPANRYYASELPQRSYDPEKAKFHLKQAGLSSLQVDLSAAETAFAGAVDAAVLYKEHAAYADIEINVIREPNDGYWSNVWMKKPWCAVYWSGRPTEDLMFSTAYAAGAAWNDTFWNHDKFNQLLVAARAELDDTKRREMYVEMQRIVSDEGGVVVPMFASYVGAHTDKLAHQEEVGKNYDMDGGKITERWWFA